MISNARVVGRPARTESGQIMILERVRVALRDAPIVDLNRREIAEIARVSPALISFYFPDRASLFKAATQPVIDEYVEGLRKILADTGALTSKLRRLVGFYINFNFQEGCLLDFHLQHSKQLGGPEDLTELKKAYQEIVGFFDDMMQMQLLGDGCPSNLNTMLWGMCKTVAGSLREKLLGVSDELIASNTEAVYNRFVEVAKAA